MAMTILELCVKNRRKVVLFCATILLQVSTACLAEDPIQHRRAGSPRNELILPYDDHKLYLTPGAHRKLVEFVAHVGAGQPSLLRIAVASSDPDLPIKPLTETLASLGIALENIRIITSLGRHDKNIRIIAERLGAQPKPCKASDVSMAYLGSDNQPEPGFGCANDMNLKAMVADPSDLGGNRARLPSDAERSAIPVARYRNFTTPALPAPATSQTLSTPTSR